ncbi:hypothetical protein [Cupriavidus sp. H19C3]|uniref:hypothetical protein n=1 Tax=Cupriavidus sp. H19C3 TaxID=3241603 RepID=UPI003BF85C12
MKFNNCQFLTPFLAISPIIIKIVGTFTPIEATPMIISVFLHALTGSALGCVPYQLRKRYHPYWWVALLVLGLLLLAWAGWPEMWTAIGWRDQTPLEIAEAISQQRFGQAGNYIMGSIFIGFTLVPFICIGAIREPK